MNVLSYCQRKLIVFFTAAVQIVLEFQKKIKFVVVFLYALDVCRSLCDKNNGIEIPQFNECSQHTEEVSRCITFASSAGPQVYCKSN